MSAIPGTSFRFPMCEEAQLLGLSAAFTSMIAETLTGSGAPGNRTDSPSFDRCGVNYLG